MRLTRTDYTLVRLASRAAGLVRLLGDIESEGMRATLDAAPVERPVFLTGLARSGTTILLQELAATGLFATHQYRDFPLVMAPCLWSRLTGRLSGEQTPMARPHQDRIEITPHSPEAFEEPIWQHFFPHVHASKELHTLGAATRNERFECFFRDHMRKIMLLRGCGRYLSKGNYNLTRIEYLARIFPDARFVVPLRSPVRHVESLVRQHELFCRYAAQDPRVPHYLACAGHYEFGPQRVAIRLQHNEADAATAAWRDGREHLGYALQWAQVYARVDELRSNPALAERMLIVRYEDFCSEPRRTLKTILNFAGAASPCDWSARTFDHISPPSKDMDLIDRAALDDIAAATAAIAERFGYATGLMEPAAAQVEQAGAV